MSDERSFDYRVSGRANLHYFAAVARALRAAEARGRAAALLERVGLGAPPIADTASTRAA